MYVCISVDSWHLIQGGYIALLLFIFVERVVISNEVNHFKVYSSGAFSTFTVVWDQHLCRVPECLRHPKEKPVHSTVTPHSSVLAVPGNHQSACPLWVYLFCNIHIIGIVQYEIFCVCLFSLSMFSRLILITCQYFIPSSMEDLLHLVYCIYWRTFGMFLPLGYCE